MGILYAVLKKNFFWKYIFNIFKLRFLEYNYSLLFKELTDGTRAISLGMLQPVNNTLSNNFQI